MRVFVLGAGAAGSLLSQLIARQGHTVWCGDRDPVRARRFLGPKSPIRIVEANARNVWSIVRAGRGCHLLVNAAPPVFNGTVLRAALRLGSHYLDLASHLGKYPFKAEQTAFAARFERRQRVAVFDAGAAPGLTNLLAARAAEMLERVDSVHVRLFEETEGEDPISQWSAEGSFEEALSRPRVYRDGRFHLGRRFGERERFRFPSPVGEVPVYLAAQDEVVTLPRVIPMREMDAKIGGNEIQRLRRWHRQGKLRRSRGRVDKRFPDTPTPRRVARLIREGVLHNAHFAAAVLVRGGKGQERLLVRWDCQFPSLYGIRRRGLLTTPIAYATAQIAALFVKHLPRKTSGVFPPEALAAATRRAILADVRTRGFRIVMKVTRRREEEEEE